MRLVRTHARTHARGGGARQRRAGVVRLPFLGIVGAAWKASGPPRCQVSARGRRTRLNPIRRAFAEVNGQCVSTTHPSLTGAFQLDSSYPKNRQA